MKSATKHPEADTVTSVLQSIVSASSMPERIAPNMIRVYRLFTHLDSGYIVPHDTLYSTKGDGLEALRQFSDEYPYTTFALYDESIYLN